MREKIIIAGGTGALESSIVKQYYDTGTDIVVLSRSAGATDKNMFMTSIPI